MRRPLIVGLACSLWLLAAVAQAQSGRARSYYLLAAASTNATVVTGCQPTDLDAIEAFSINGQIVYLRFYNQCSAPTSANTPILVVALPPGMQTTADTVGHVSVRFPRPVRFSTGLSLRTTTGIAVDNDTGIPVGSQVIVNLAYTN